LWHFFQNENFATEVVIFFSFWKFCHKLIIN